MTGIGFGEFVGNAMLLYALIRYAPKRWWMWAAGLVTTR